MDFDPQNHLNFAIKSSWSEPQSAPDLFFFFFLLSVYSFSIFSCKEYYQPDFSVDCLVMSMCTIIFHVVGKGCFLWLAGYLDQTFLAFALLRFIFQGRSCLLLQVSLHFLLLHSIPLLWKTHLFLVLVLKGLVGLPRSGQHQLLRHWWLGNRLELLWCWMVCLGNELRLLRLHPSTAFQTHLLTMRATLFLLRDSCLTLQ